MTPPNHVNFEAEKLFGAVGEIIVKANESFLVNGMMPHSVWSNTDDETVMIGISIKPV